LDTVSKKDPVTELRRGALELGLLAFISKEACFGGGIITGLAEASNGGLTLTEGSLYPALHRLEKKKLLSSEWQEGVNGGRRRKYYLITEKGSERLGVLSAAWNELSGGISALLDGDDE
jgi:PadR family transcriptional regulator PadR